MTRARCLIVSTDASLAIAPQLLRALQSEPWLDVGLSHACNCCVTESETAQLVLVVIDRQSADQSLEFIQQLIARHPGSSIVAVGQDLRRQYMATLLAAGIADFTTWPCSDDEILARVQRVLGHVSGPAARRSTGTRDPRLKNIIGNGAAFVKQLEHVPVIAGCDVDVMIHGETGTGKEVFAQAVHYLSQRASRPWVAFNCGAIPTDLMESELFGHVRGAFTNAHGARDGLVAEAEGGTLFLDDVDCLPLAAQAKLLRFLQEREYRPLGSNRLRHADVRVIASTNRRLPDLCTKGLFRQDLYYRMNVMSLTLPPLRDRREDVGALVLHFAALAAKRFGRPAVTVSPVAIRKLLSHDWPGNVRELQHIIERAVLLAASARIGEADIELGGNDPAGSDDSSFRAAKARVVEQFERSFIEQRLLECEGNVTLAAREARKNRRAFFELMRKHAIEPDRFRPSK